MKQSFLLAFILLMFTHCKKNNGLHHLYSKFAGKWEYENFSGYPFNNNFLPPGNGRLLILYQDGNFERRRNDTLEYKGRYQLENKPDCYPGGNTIYFSTDETNYPYGSYIGIDNNKLTLSSSNCLADGGTTFYRRIE